MKQVTVGKRVVVYTAEHESTGMSKECVTNGLLKIYQDYVYFP